MFKRSFNIVAIIVAIVITGFCYLTVSMIKGSTGPFSMDWINSVPQGDTVFGGIFYNPFISDTLPHYKYQLIADSIKTKKSSIELNNKSIVSGQTFGLIGIYEIKKDWAFHLTDNYETESLIKRINDSMALLYNQTETLGNKDSIKQVEKLLGELRWRSNLRYNELEKIKEQQQEKLYYLGLEGYSLADYSTNFFIDKGTYNLAYVVRDTIFKRTFDSTVRGHYERKQIAVRYAKEDKRILISISKKTHDILNIAMNILTLSVFSIAAYLFIGIPIQILINISNGKAFLEKNILRFRLMSLGVFTITIITIISPYLIRAFFNSMIPADFELTPFYYAFISNLYPLFIALALFLISLAFEKGYKLQQENLLTI